MRPVRHIEEVFNTEQFRRTPHFLILSGQHHVEPFVHSLCWAFPQFSVGALVRLVSLGNFLDVVFVLPRPSSRRRFGPD